MSTALSSFRLSFAIQPLVRHWESNAISARPRLELCSAFVIAPLVEEAIFRLALFRLAAALGMRVIGTRRRPEPRAALPAGFAELGGTDDLDRFLAFGQTTTSLVQSSPIPPRGLPLPG